MTRTVHIVSHSHWDREWHLTFQQFRLRLVRVIDDLLQVLANDPAFTHFMLDGQTIVLEDYAEMRPEQLPALRQHIVEGRVSIGPWYIHPDEFLVSGEALVRNLLLGKRICQEWGGCMNVGYIPDQFGHIAQLPQIWQGFGIDNVVLWRGVARAEARTAAVWQGHDGSKVLLAALPDGYNQAEHLPAGGQALAERLRTLAGSLEALSEQSQPLLIMNGGDHQGIHRDLPGRLRTAQEALGADYTLQHSTLPAYIKALQAACTPAATITGELRNSRNVFLLPGVLSTRIWIKQRNDAAQRLLEREAEPLSTIAHLLGEPYPAGELRQSWRYLLQNQPHDSVCGCSIDQVHREMVTRYDWSEQIAVALRDTALATLASRVDSVVPGAQDPRTLAITVYNGAPSPQAGRIDLTLHLVGAAHAYELVDGAGAPVAHDWIGEHGEGPTNVEMPAEEVPDLDTIMAQVEGNRVMGFGIGGITMRTMGDALQVELTIGDQALLSRAEIQQAVYDAFTLAESAGSHRAEVTIHRSAELHLAALTPPVPACGYTTLLLRPRHKAGSRAEQPIATAPELLPMIENERYRVEADPTSGSLTITERASMLRITPANVFLDGGDIGDLYTHCPPSTDNQLSSTAIIPTIHREVGPLGQSLQLRFSLLVPRSLDSSRLARAEDTVPLTINTEVRLAPGDQLVRFHTRVENAASDHRLRVHMRLPFTADHVHAEDAFALVHRAAQPQTEGQWAEQPVGTAPHQGVVAVHSADAACVLAAPGLPEYELLTASDGTSELALTLLRCTGWLSRNDIPTRPADAGPPLPTPEAQCHGQFSFDYALSFGTAAWRTQLPPARAFATPLRTHVAACAEGSLPPTASFVAVQPAAIVLSALKGAEDGQGVMLRVYNDDEIAHTAHLQLLLPIRRATLVSLAEVNDRLLYTGKPVTELEVEVLPGKIVSLRLEA